MQCSVKNCGVLSCNQDKVDTTKERLKNNIVILVGYNLAWEPSHGGLYRWRENSLTFFLYRKLKEILIKNRRIILKASKDRIISKI